ncbi:MAG: hypothetical protein Q7S92_05690 [Candidatus Diapherotrites archaeon]|nr:hypothetical protein [Candidatus Diapherotrites archaeon]
MENRWKNLILVLVLIGILYLAFPYLSTLFSGIQPKSITETQAKIAFFYSENQIEFVLTDFDLIQVQDSGLTKLIQSLQTYKTQNSSSPSVVMLTDIYLLNAEKTQSRKNLAKLNFELDEISSEQICVNISKFEERQTVLEEVFSKTLALNQKINEFETQYSAQAAELSLLDLQTETRILQNLIISSQEQVNELKALCG